MNVIKEDAMTKELLEQYPDICAEIEELKAKDRTASRKPKNRKRK